MSLETSVTLDDVFAVVSAKRVPLAPELAGYLALEIADGADARGGEVDPRSVYIGDEGSVALVRPKKDGGTGDAEASVRNILARLLEASGSQTPALGGCAKRKPGQGLAALVEELEAALIPVNRAAGRRALARLAREVKRVTMGVGRNATAERKAEPAPERPHTPGGGVPVPARPVATSFDDEAQTMPKRVPVAENAPPPPLPPILGAPAAPARGATPAPPPGKLPPPPVAPPPLAGPPPKRGEGRETEKLFGGDEVDDLLSSFGVSDSFEDDSSMGRELKAMVGVEPTPPPPDAQKIADLVKPQRPAPGKPEGLPGKPEAPPPKAAEAEDDVEALLAMADEPGPKSAPPAAAAGLARPSPAKPIAVARVEPAEPPARPEPPPKKLAEPPPPPMASASKVAPAPPEPAPSKAAEAAPGAVPGEFREPRAPRTGMFLLVLLLLVLVGAVVGLYFYKPQIFAGRFGDKPTPTQTAAPSVSAAPPRCKVSLTVASIPSDAEVLLRVGQAPVDVERMPRGPRLEFVATAEGYAPKRTVIPKGAAWDTAPDGKPRYELAVQLDPTKAKPGQPDPWPPGEPGSEVGGSGQPGTVHIVATPRGAEIWLLAGVGPQAQIDQLRCDADVEVLVAGKTRQRLKVAQKDIEGVPSDPLGIKAVRINVQPEPK